MRKIPTLFARDPDDLRHLLPKVTPGCEWVLAGEGVATRKYDGTCVMLDFATLLWFARREVKPGKSTPPGFIKADYDEVTGKTVGWEPVEQSSFAKVFATVDPLPDSVGTYELCGPKVNRNPEGYETHRLIRHVDAEIDVLTSNGEPRDFEGCRSRVVQLGERGWEGIVWHHPDGRMAKLKAKDFR